MRKWFLATLPIQIQLLVCPAGFSANWPQYRGPHGDGISPETVSTAWSGEKPKQLWHAETPAGFSSFAVDRARVFTMETRDQAGTPSEFCVALDARSGKELWRTALGTAKYPGGGDSGTEENKGGDGPRSTPTVSGDRVYVYTADMILSCLDAETGTKVWSKDIVKDFSGKNISWKNAMSPVIDGELLYIAGGGPGQAMIALNKGSGEVAWKNGDGAMTHASPLVTTLHGVRQVIYILQNGVISLDAASGKELWTFKFPYQVSTACLPVVAGDIVFLTAGYDIGAAGCQVTREGDQFQAKEIWRVKKNKPLGDLWSPPVAKDGYLYGMISFKEFGKGPLKCVDAKTGEVKWEQPGFGAGNVVLTKNVLLALADDGQVVLVQPSPEKYIEIARFKAVKGKCWSTPALADGKLYVRSTKEGACYDVAAKP